MKQWISVKDRLPEHNQFFLGFHKSKNIVILRCDLHQNGSQVFDYVFMTPDLKKQVRDITHWQPLPNPPEGE